MFGIVRCVHGTIQVDIEKTPTALHRPFLQRYDIHEKNS